MILKNYRDTFKHFICKIFSVSLYKIINLVTGQLSYFLFKHTLNCWSNYIYLSKSLTEMIYRQFHEIIQPERYVCLQTINHNLGCWLHSYFQFKVSSQLYTPFYTKPKFSLEPWTFLKIPDFSLKNFLILHLGLS